MDEFVKLAWKRFLYIKCEIDNAYGVLYWCRQNHVHVKEKEIRSIIGQHIAELKMLYASYPFLKEVGK